MLTNKKPQIDSKLRKHLKQNKWDIGNEHCEELLKMGCTVVFFNCTDTPHMRIDDWIDYWPASSRFYDRYDGLWGAGFEDLKLCVVSRRLLEKELEEKHGLSYSV